MMVKIDKPNINTKEYLDKFYANPEWRKDYSGADARLKLLAERMDGHNTVLDVGCADGIFATYYVNKHPNATMFGVDLSDEAIKLAKQTYKEGIFVQSDLYELPYEDKTFHAVACSEVLEHLEYPWKALQEMRRVLKDGATLYLTTPNSAVAEYEEHLWRWNLEGINDLLRGYFKIVEESSTFYNEHILYVKAQRI